MDKHLNNLYDDINPIYCSINDLFDSNRIYEIPIYQRAYAWDKESVKDFIDDLENCRLKRESQNPLTHFFGTIISVEQKVQGSSKLYSHEIIDGQQRLVTFTLLLKCIKSLFIQMKEEIQNPQIISKIDKYIKDITSQYFEIMDKINMKAKSFYILKLSEEDETFYRQLIDNPLGKNLDTKQKLERDSHKKLIWAFSEISLYIQRTLEKDKTLDKKIQKLETYLKILNEDFAVIHLSIRKRKDAFRLFQVINNK